VLEILGVPEKQDAAAIDRQAVMYRELPATKSFGSPSID
jgi:hypothetical protein